MRVKSIDPYVTQPDRAFWRRAVASDHVTQIKGLFEGVPGLATSKVATGGSCFAQHIGRFLKARGMAYLDYEPPPSFLSPTEADRFGYGVYSCRYGNIYTVRQLRQLFEEAFGMRSPKDRIWKKGDRYYDALRPGVEPNGFESPEEVDSLRASHLLRVRALFMTLDVFVFTLGLTEAWLSKADDTVYPVAPGVIAGTFDAKDYVFKNFRYNEICHDLIYVIKAMRTVNPSARMILTVSPVPLAATATDKHVLSASSYSKSVLRSVAGDISDDIEGVYYFPSYEVITGQPTRHMFYNPDLRTVCSAGVAEVMRHFFAEPGAAPPAEVSARQDLSKIAGYEHCEESLIGASAA